MSCTPSSAPAVPSTVSVPERTALATSMSPLLSRPQVTCDVDADATSTRIIGAQFLTASLLQITTSTLVVVVVAVVVLLSRNCTVLRVCYGSCMNMSVLSRPSLHMFVERTLDVSVKLSSSVMSDTLGGSERSI